ncbi:hypothetical protein KO507_07135 [Gilvimarinus agarilyticus]|uniref:DUF6491 family protein n=1 Tax=Gilvimarinus sp. 2_MG-2023 TaxID=3062666 RepID=UPI001C09CBE8|nr:DUF6491 family protein [Gilvimarinus sp. 2_MG-2023]MBU2885532.1 hypothetical protein [Gilvimarinus agarilyticus]MDO6570431.1 DUF6491 family protein [Gilvimarinus sp. 2_MG-2023]
MFYSHKLLCTTIVASAISLGCSTSTKPAAPSMTTALLEVTQQNGRACVQVNDITGYGVLERDVISINARGNHYYLATVRPGCFDLGISPNALFDDHFGDVCGGGVSRLRTGDSHCQIRSVFEFEDREQAFTAHDDALTIRKQSQQKDKP